MCYISVRKLWSNRASVVEMTQQGNRHRDAETCQIGGDNATVTESSHNLDKSIVSSHQKLNCYKYLSHGCFVKAKYVEILPQDNLLIEATLIYQLPIKTSGKTKTDITFLNYLYWVYFPFHGVHSEGFINSRKICLYTHNGLYKCSKATLRPYFLVVFFIIFVL